MPAATARAGAGDGWGGGGEGDGEGDGGGERLVVVSASNPPGGALLGSRGLGSFEDVDVQQRPTYTSRACVSGGGRACARFAGLVRTLELPPSTMAV